MDLPTIPIGDNEDAPPVKDKDGFSFASLFSGKKEEERTDAKIDLSKFTNIKNYFASLPEGQQVEFNEQNVIELSNNIKNMSIEKMIESGIDEDTAINIKKEIDAFLKLDETLDQLEDFLRELLKHMKPEHIEEEVSKLIRRMLED